MLSVLALEVTERLMRAAVLRRGFKGIEPELCAAGEREEGSGPLPTPEELASLLNRLPVRPRRATLATPLVTVMEVTLEKARLRHLRGGKLKEALRWEVEPFLPAPPTDYYLGFQRGPEVEPGRVVFWVAALPREDYRALKNLFAERGLQLGKVFPPEFCFPLGGALGFRGRRYRTLLVLEVGRAGLRCALVERGRMQDLYAPPPEVGAALAAGFSTPLPGAPPPELVASLREGLALREMLGLPVVLVGAGLNLDLAALYARQLLGTEEVLLPLWVQEGCGPEFATVVGAGVRQLTPGSASQGIGVDDWEERLARLRERVHLYPLIAVLSVGLIFGGHYLVLKQQTKRCQREIAVLEQQKKEIEAAQNRYNQLKKEEETLRKKVQAVEAQTHFLREGYRTEEIRVSRLLDVAAREEPFGVKIREVSKLGRAPAPETKDKKGAKKETKEEFLPVGAGEEERAYRLGGESPDVEGINRLLLSYQAQPWCAYARLDSLKQESAKGGSGQEEKVTYRFIITVVVKE
ncbi:hypothetical protein [Ammonifex thiophilus]|uniref:Uncharacterized protein n=1 Tax=Ammonifex thiophilus TaxID=444093 RepID=A0A3D8P1Y1_9THEO|nr:hypothetical protein [Ammonifex thiophilus]RDV82074.1 hypothetical protein DXX99_08475 [Ammonifex thiophilus]